MISLLPTLDLDNGYLPIGSQAALRFYVYCPPGSASISSIIPHVEGGGWFD